MSTEVAVLGVGVFLVLVGLAMAVFDPGERYPEPVYCWLSGFLSGAGLLMAFFGADLLW